MNAAGMCCTRKIAAGRSAGKPGRKVLIVVGPPVEIPMAIARISLDGGLAGRTAGRDAIKAGRDGGDAAGRGCLRTPDAAAARTLVTNSSAIESRLAETVPS